MLDRTTQSELLASIIMNPLEDTPRLMYSDELMESDDRLDQQYGQYIKLTIELERHKNLVKPRVDNKLVGITYDDNNNYKINSYEWYRKGIELNEQINKLWYNSVSTHYLFSYLKDIVHNNNRFLRDQIEFKITPYRGFIESIKCTGEQWLQVCDKLVWHDSMTNECRDCKGTGDEISDGQGTCGSCLGKGKVPKPCPLTAHPVKKVEITSYTNRVDFNDEINIWGYVLAPKYDIKFSVFKNV